MRRERELSGREWLRLSILNAYHFPGQAYDALYVEVLRRWRLLPRASERVSLRTTRAVLRLIGEVPEWKVEAVWHSPSCYPVLGGIDRALYQLPWAGALFRHKLCIRLRRVG
jgi:hypothetical protein